MNNTLLVKAKNSPEFLERLLRVCRHRGFMIITMDAQVDSLTQTIKVIFTVSSVRELSLLSKQIEKIIGVIQVDQISQQNNIKASA